MQTTEREIVGVYKYLVTHWAMARHTADFLMEPEVSKTETSAGPCK